MLICSECGKIIGEIGNGKKMYSCCLSCGKDYEERQRLEGQVPDDVINAACIAVIQEEEE